MLKDLKNFVPMCMILVIFILSFSITVVVGKSVPKEPVIHDTDSAYSQSSVPDSSVSGDSSKPDESSSSEGNSSSPDVSSGESSASEANSDSVSSAEPKETDSESTSSVSSNTSTAPDNQQPADFISMLKAAGYKTSDVKGSQLVIVKSYSAFATIYSYEKDSAGVWKLNKTYENGFVGQWGVSDNVDDSWYCSPRGLFTIGKAFGFEKVTTGLDFFQIKASTYWITDSSASDYYSNSDSASSDKGFLMKNDSTLKCGFVIGSGKDGVSSYFMSCSDFATDKNIGLSESNVKELLSWLNKSASPQILVY